MSTTSTLPIRLLALGAAVIALAACAGTASSADSVQSALNEDTDAGLPDPTACLTTFVECRRSEGSDPTECRHALRDCMHPGHPPHGDGGAPPPPDGPRGEGHHRGDGDGDGHGKGHGRGKGHGPGGGPGHHHDGDEAPPDASAPPPPGDGPKGPRACIHALDDCAAGTDPVATCVDNAKTCLAAYPPPPKGHRRHR